MLPLASCSSGIQKDGLVSLELVGELTHVQYWDHNDKWDLKSLDLQLMYDDGEVCTLNATDSSITYTFSPESPEGLDHSVTSFSIVEAYYTDYKGVKYSIPPRTFTGISIVDYPYKDDNGFSAFLRNCIPFLLPAVIVGIVLVMIFTIRKKKKAE